MVSSAIRLEVIFGQPRRVAKECIRPQVSERHCGAVGIAPWADGAAKANQVFTRRRLHSQYCFVRVVADIVINRPTPSQRPLRKHSILKLLHVFCIFEVLIDRLVAINAFDTLARIWVQKIGKVILNKSPLVRLDRQRSTSLLCLFFVIHDALRLKRVDL